MPYVNHGALRIHYEVEGTGEPLVLQHGFILSLKRWYALGYVDALKPKFRLILIDARGHGESDKPHEPAAYGLDLRVRDVVAVLDAIKVQTAHFWGYSMGGWIGFGMAKYAADRVRSLTIGGEHPYQQQFAKLNGSDPDACLAAVFGGIEVVASFPPALRADILANDFQALAAARQDRPSLEGLLPALSTPCCFYAGDADPVYEQVERCASSIPHATFVGLRGLDHGGAFREAARILPHVTNFIQKVT
jgi:pimeloyl-ACP methyl ester carboxylesterase